MKLNLMNFAKSLIPKLELMQEPEKKSIKKY